MVTQYIDQTLPLITQSAFEAVLQQIVDILILEELNQRVQADNSGKAQGTLTLAVQSTDGDTMTVDAKVYTFQDILTDVDGNIKIGVDLLATQANIVGAFDLSGVTGTDYAANMTAHPTVDIDDFSSNNAILTAKTSGVAGNSIVTTETFADSSNVFDAATLGTTRAGVAIVTDDFGFKTVKEIHNPFQAFQDFKIPVVNVRFDRSEFAARNLRSKKNSVSYAIDIYTEEASSETEQGLSLSSFTANRVIRQILYILDSPKYPNLRLDYQDSNGNLVKFIEKLSVSSAQKLFTKEPLPKENIAIAQMIFSVDMIEEMFDLEGNELKIINTLILDPTTQ